MKICDLTQFYSPVSGGVRRYLGQKVQYLREQNSGDEHILIVPGEKTAMEDHGVARVYTIGSPLVAKNSRYRMILALHLVEEVLEKELPDIIESGDPYQVAWKAVASGKGLRIPVVGFYHSHFPEAYIRSVAKYFGRFSVTVAEEISERYVRHLYNHFQRTFVPSPALAGLLESWGVERVANIDLGVDTEIFFPDASVSASVRRELGVPEGRIHLLYVGRLAPEKNVRTLLDAFGHLCEREPSKYFLTAIGDGTFRAGLQRLQQKTGAVHWSPYCNDSRALANYYRSADVFVHPSVNETFGLVTIESQACGTPVVGIRGSYMDRIIFTSQANWAEENSPEALAEAVEKICAQDLREAGLEASRIVRDRYSWQKVFGRLFSIYREVIAEYK